MAKTIHSMIRVLDEARSLDFYNKAFGLAVADRLDFPDFTLINTSVMWVSAVTIAIVASLETLLNLEAVDKLYPKKLSSPPSREVVAQGAVRALARFDTRQGVSYILAAQHRATSFLRLARPLR